MWRFLKPVNVLSQNVADIKFAQYTMYMYVTNLKCNWFEKLL